MTGRSSNNLQNILPGIPGQPRLLSRLSKSVSTAAAYNECYFKISLVAGCFILYCFCGHTGTVELAWKMIPRRSVRKIADNMRGIFWHTGCEDVVLVLVVLNFHIPLFEILAVLSFTKKSINISTAAKNPWKQCLAWSRRCTVSVKMNRVWRLGSVFLLLSVTYSRDVKAVIFFISVTTEVRKSIYRIVLIWWRKAIIIITWRDFFVMHVYLYHQWL